MNSMIKDVKLAVVIPSLNEENTLPKLLNQLNELLSSFKFLKQHNLIVVDDGSTDNTIENNRYS